MITIITNKKKVKNEEHKKKKQINEVMNNGCSIGQTLIRSIDEHFWEAVFILYIDRYEKSYVVVVVGCF